MPSSTHFVRITSWHCDGSILGVVCYCVLTAYHMIRFHLGIHVIHAIMYILVCLIMSQSVLVIFRPFDYVRMSCVLHGMLSIAHICVLPLSIHHHVHLFQYALQDIEEYNVHASTSALQQISGFVHHYARCDVHMHLSSNTR